MTRAPCRPRALVLAAATFAVTTCAASRGADGEFVRLGPPGPDDWRTVFPEPIQTLEDYELAMGHAPPFEERRAVLVPLGTAREGDEEDLAALAGFLGAYYMTRVEVQPREEVPHRVRRRSSHGFGRQFLAGDVLGHVGRAVPADALARVAITSDDLYAIGPRGGEMNFVFGMGDTRAKAAVCSSARFAWHYPDEPPRTTGRRRLFKLAAHETGHVLGLAHCQEHACCMNGSNSLVESDAAPFHLCPTCLAKAARYLGFDRALRYRALERAYRECGWHDEARFAARRARVEAAAALANAGRASPVGEARE